MPTMVTSSALYYIEAALGRDFIYHGFEFQYYVFRFRAGNFLVVKMNRINCLKKHLKHEGQLSAFTS
jgi:hypothetical protein